MKRSLLSLSLALLATTATAQVKVKSDTLEVRESRDKTSAVVKTLKQGEEVLIDMSMTGEDGQQWCTIRETTKKDRLGYVPCQFLDRPTRTAVSPPRSAPPAQPVSQALPGPKRQSPQTLGETRWLGYADLIAKTFQFNDQQNEQIVQLARQNGMPSCVYKTDSYPGPGLPPEMLSTSPITTCHWYAQTFYEQVFALITPEQKAARKASYETFTREVAGNRRVIEQRAKGQ